MTNNPYFNQNPLYFSQITEGLVNSHPLKDHLVKHVLSSWEGLFSSSIGSFDLRIGRDIFPKPQIIGALLHELIPASICREFPGLWSPERHKNDKDIVCLTDDFYSIELKTSSNRSQIFGNRSYAQPSSVDGKSKSGFYLTVNFEPFVEGATLRPRILLIRFGWLDHTDWIAQTASTGQQARLAPSTYQSKFLTLYSV